MSVTIRGLLTSSSFRGAYLVRCSVDGCLAQLVIDDHAQVAAGPTDYKVSAERRRRAVIAAGWICFGGATTCPRCSAELEQELTDSAVKQWRWERDQALRIERVG